VTGEITKMLGTLDFYSKQKKPCRFYGFQLQVTREFDEWPEKENRKRQWVRAMTLFLIYTPQVKKMFGLHRFPSNKHRNY
jgi:hypothetical protein